MIDRSLDEALQFGRELKEFYQSPAGLQRGENDFAIPEAMNWAWHFFMGREIEWVRQAIRDDAGNEWRNKHPGENPIVSEPGSPPPVPPPIQPPDIPPTNGGGFVEPINAGGVRPRLSRGQIESFLPERGPFMFPAPYNTRCVRVTNASDGSVRPTGMAYWPQINNHTGRRELRVLAAINDVLTIFAVDKTTGQVERRQQLPYNMTGESCYFSFTDPDVLYTCPSNGGRFCSFNLATEQEIVIAENVKQPHSSADGSVHSFTMDGGPAVWRDGGRDRITKFPAKGGYDECQIDKSGRWLLSKEAFVHADNEEHGDNRIIDLDSGQEFIFRDEDGAVGHSDMGYGYVIGEEDQSQPGGNFRLWKFEPGGVSDGRFVYNVGGWKGMTRYVSHCNARPGSPDFQRVLYSSAVDDDLSRVNEIVVGSLNPSDFCRVVAPNMADLNAIGGGDPYWRKTRANIDPPGTFYCFSANMAGDRMDLFVGQV